MAKAIPPTAYSAWLALRSCTAHIERQYAEPAAQTPMTIRLKYCFAKFAINPLVCLLGRLFVVV